MTIHNFLNQLYRNISLDLQLTIAGAPLAPRKTCPVRFCSPARNAAFQARRLAFQPREPVCQPWRAWLRGIRQLIFRDKFIDVRYSRPDAASDVSKAAITRSRESGFTSPAAAGFALIFMNSIKTVRAATGQEGGERSKRIDPAISSPRSNKTEEKERKNARPAA